MTCSIVIPVYNSADFLNDVILGLKAQLNLLVRFGDMDAYEIILVNDGSKDASWEAMLGISGVTRINLERNFGQHNALLCGIRHARYEYIITMDDDGQHPHHEIPRLLDELRKGYDVVYGVPLIGGGFHVRELLSVGARRILAWAVGNGSIHIMSSFRGFRASLRDGFKDYNNPNVFIDALLYRKAVSYSYIDVQNCPRNYGVSNYTLKSLTVLFLNILSNFSDLPVPVWISKRVSISGAQYSIKEIL
jgi:glycosyltransferase involved in cell wall biosynthesis